MGGQGGQGGTGGRADAASSSASASSSTGGNVGNITTNNNYRAFGSTNAPNLSGSVDHCMAVTGRSYGINVMGTDAAGIGFGKQKVEYNEKCAAVSVGTNMLNTAGRDPQKEALGLGILSEALPGQVPQAIEKTVERVNAYAAKNSNTRPSSVLELFGAKALKNKTVVAAPVKKEPEQKSPCCCCTVNTPAAK